MVSYGVYGCSVGMLVIGWVNEAVVSLKLGNSSGIAHCPCIASDLAATQIREYLDGTRTEFDFPFSLSGTPFQRSVWEALQQIPYGHTVTYSQIATQIGKPKAARAVGQAVNRNPLWIVVPCHRVVGKGRSLTGYAGGLKLKKLLLDLEQSHT